MAHPKRVYRWTLAILFITGIVGLLVPLPRMGGREISAMSDLAHLPIFALLAFLAFQFLVYLGRSSNGTSALIAWAIAVGFGVAVEIEQHFVGRTFSLEDILADGIGAAVGVLLVILVQPRPSRSRRSLIVVVAGLMLVGVMPATLVLVDTLLQRREFPVIDSFEHPLEMSRWQGWWSRLHRNEGHATDGRWSLRVDFVPGAYPGIRTAGLRPNWSDHRELVFDVELDEGPPLEIAVLVEDRSSEKTSKDRFERRVRLEPGRQEIVIPLADIEQGPASRRLDLQRISSLQIFTINLDRPRTLFLDHIRVR